MFQNIVICYGEAAIEVKTMAEGILAVTVFCMFGLGFYIANKADQFWGEIQENMEEKNVKQELEKALQRLPERERIIMVLYYQENMTLKEIGATINMSESRVCQLHAQAIMKLKNILSENRTSRMRQSIIA